MKLRATVLSLRRFRVWHRMSGLLLAVLIVISALTGILLALKKNVDVLQPPTQKGISNQLADWLPLDSLHKLSLAAMQTHRPKLTSIQVERMDVRPDKGIAKVLFDQGYWEVQIDGTNGQVRSIEQRHADWIESLHDGSIISQWFKLTAMHFLGIGLLFMLASGIWLWYGPRKVRNARKGGEA